MANRIFKTYSFLDDEFRKLFERELANENNETVIIKKDDIVNNQQKKGGEEQ